MNSKHYLLRLSKMNKPFLVVEYASLFGIYDALKEVEKVGYKVVKGRVNKCVTIDVECCLTGHDKSEHVGQFFIDVGVLDKTQIQRILIKNRLN